MPQFFLIDALHDNNSEGLATIVNYRGVEVCQTWNENHQDMISECWYDVFIRGRYHDQVDVQDLHAAGSDDAAKFRAAIDKGLFVPVEELAPQVPAPKASNDELETHQADHDYNQLVAKHGSAEAALRALTRARAATLDKHDLFAGWRQDHPVTEWTSLHVVTDEDGAITGSLACVANGTVDTVRMRFPSMTQLQAWHEARPEAHVYLDGQLLG